MPDDPNRSPNLNQWIDRLACPACLGVLRAEEEKIVCIGCGRIYPVVDGIPILIAQDDNDAAH
jgi:hypothetical protein